MDHERADTFGRGDGFAHRPLHGSYQRTSSCFLALRRDQFTDCDTESGLSAIQSNPRRGGTMSHVMRLRLCAYRGGTHAWLWSFGLLSFAPILARESPQPTQTRDSRLGSDRSQWTRREIDGLGGSG